MRHQLIYCRCYVYIAQLVSFACCHQTQSPALAEENVISVCSLIEILDKLEVLLEITEIITFLPGFKLGPKWWAA